MDMDMDMDMHMHMHMHMHAHVMEKGTSCSEKEVASATGGDTAIDQES